MPRGAEATILGASDGLDELRGVRLLRREGGHEIRKGMQGSTCWRQSQKPALVLGNAFLPAPAHDRHEWRRHTEAVTIKPCDQTMSFGEWEYMHINDLTRKWVGHTEPVRFLLRNNQTTFGSKLTS